MPGHSDPSRMWQRYEVKYLISEPQAAEIRRYCLGHLPPDSHAPGLDGGAYPVLSLYLDSPARDLLRHTLIKQVNRYKLRARCYRQFQEPETGQPAFVEIKRRIDGVVQKTRAAVSAQTAQALLWERCLLPADGGSDPITRQNVNEFVQLSSRIGAFPVLGVYYTREAYEGLSADRIRITLDRNLHYGLLARPGSGRTETWWPVDPGGVVLEVKFTNTYPFWVADMLRRVEVIRRGVCKYLICSQAAGLAVDETVNRSAC